MVLISIPLFLLISIFGIIQLCFTKEFFSKILTFFYFTTNFITFMLIYFLYSNKFGFIVEMIFLLIILNMILTLLFIKNKVDGNIKWSF